uniref:RING-type E3 ubiquitin transferase n=1 Tax=Rhizophora mucronata TaxID=61149 RepID=A0A2P2JD10_RHIMU
MASDAEVAPEFSEASSIFQRLLMRRDLSVFLPFVLGFTSATTEGESPNPTQEPGQETSGNQQERIILINPFTQGMVVIEGTDSLDYLFRDLAIKNGEPPASKASIEALPCVEIGETEDKDGECVICLEEWELGGVVKKMPCKHRFHPKCIEKWLGMHGSCPVCRYKMPVDEEELGKRRGEGERRRLGREIWVSFSLNGNRRNSDSNQNPATDSNDVSSSSLAADHSMED